MILIKNSKSCCNFFRALSLSKNDFPGNVQLSLNVSLLESSTASLRWKCGAIEYWTWNRNCLLQVLWRVDSNATLQRTTLSKATKFRVVIYSSSAVAGLTPRHPQHIPVIKPQINAKGLDPMINREEGIDLQSTSCSFLR